MNELLITPDGFRIIRGHITGYELMKPGWKPKPTSTQKPGKRAIVVWISSDDGGRPFDVPTTQADNVMALLDLFVTTGAPPKLDLRKAIPALEAGDIYIAQDADEYRK
jgi:hypothetical protein